MTDNEDQARRKDDARPNEQLQWGKHDALHAGYRKAPAAAPAVPAVDALTNAEIRTILHKYSRFMGGDTYSDTEFACLQDVVAFAKEVRATPSTAPEDQKQADLAHVLPPVAAPVSQHATSSAAKDQAMVDLMPKRAAFLAWAKNRAFDITENRNAWGERKFFHSHVQALWDGWFNAPATYATPEQSSTAGAAKGGITCDCAMFGKDCKSLARPADAGAVAVEQTKQPLPKWIDNMKGSDPTMDGVIEFIENFLASQPQATPLEATSEPLITFDAVAQAMRKHDQKATSEQMGGAQVAIPDALFDGHAVYQEVMANDPHTPRVNADQIADVLDAVVRLIRRAAPTTEHAAAAPNDDGLDFEPDAQHAVADMANCGYSLMQAIKAHRPGYSWCDSPAEIVGDLCNELDEAKAEIAAEATSERKPLTEDEIEFIIESLNWALDQEEFDSMIKFTRAIEQHHGIGGGK